VAFAAYLAVKQCDLVRSFMGNATEILVDDKKDFAWSLVNATRLYQVEPYNDETIWQHGGLPLDAHHVVVLSMIEGCNQGGTGLLLKLLSRTGRNCDDHIGPTVYRSKAVNDWILTKGRAKPKRLFSSLQSCHSVNQTDTMVTAEI
jgi:hypothetical protein